MIIYAYVMGESVAALFLAGIVPGVLVGLGLMMVVRLLADRYDLPKAERIVTSNQTISPLEDHISFFLLRINFAGLLLIVYTLAKSTVSVTTGAEIAISNWVPFIVFLPLAHVVLLRMRKTVSADFLSLIHISEPTRPY